MRSVRTDREPTWLSHLFNNLWRPVGLAFIPVAAGFVAGATTQDSYAEFDVELMLETFSDYEQLGAEFDDS